jgi:anti-sigma factor ChrR (cupin superfamily)
MTGPATPGQSPVQPAEPGGPLPTDDMAWIPTGGGKAFRPLRFEPGGWSELMRLEPGSLVARHRHTGEVHAFNLAGSRQILETGETAGPGDYVYEPAGNVDTWQAAGDQPCIVHIKVTGDVEYLDASGAVTSVANSASQQAAYLAWCEQAGTEPAAQLRPGAVRP